MTAHFSSANNDRPLRPGEFRVWRFGESAVCRKPTTAMDALREARRLDRDAQVVDANGDEVHYVLASEIADDNS